MINQGTEMKSKKWNEVLSRPIYYVLDEHKNPVPSNIDALIQWFERGRHVRKNTIKKYNITISTIFMAIDHNFDCHRGDPRPILFETMIFINGEPDDYQERYCTWQDALKGHRCAVRMVIKKLRKEHGNHK